MIALVKGGEVLGAFVGDVNTQEIYGFRPGSKRVCRITEFNSSEILTSGKRVPLVNGYVILRDRESAYAVPTQMFINRSFKNIVVDNGSIGTWLARLWKREVVAAIIPSSWETPWDYAPIVGISLTLGYVFMRQRSDGSGWEESRANIITEKRRREGDVLVIHRDDLQYL